MPRYFYDLSQGAIVTRDEFGTVCRDDEAALTHGCAALPSVASGASIAKPWQHFEVLVRREDDLSVGRLTMTITVETPNPASRPRTIRVADGNSFPGIVSPHDPRRSEKTTTR